MQDEPIFTPPDPIAVRYNKVGSEVTFYEQPVAGRELTDLVVELLGGVPEHTELIPMKNGLVMMAIKDGVLVEVYADPKDWDKEGWLTRVLPDGTKYRYEAPVAS